MDIQKEREAFEKLPEIKKRLDMKCVHFNGTWYATNPHMGNSFATASYLNGAWSAWQAAKAQAVPEGFVLVEKELSWVKADHLACAEWEKNKALFCTENRDIIALQIEEYRLRWCKNKAHKIMSEYKAMIEAQEQSHE